MTVLVDRTGSGVDQPYVEAARVFRGAGRRQRPRVRRQQRLQRRRRGTDRHGRRLARRRPPPHRPRRRTSSRAASSRARRTARTCRRSVPRSTSTAPSTRPTSGGRAGGLSDVVVVRDDDWAAGSDAVRRAARLGRRPRRASASSPASTSRSRTSRRWAWSGWSRATSRSRSTRATAAGSGSPGATAGRHRGPHAARAPLDRRRPDLVGRPADGREREGAGRRGQQPRPGGVPLPAADRRGAEPALGDAGRAHRQRLRHVHDDRRSRHVPANAPAPQFLPYLGDYMDMKSPGKDFYGIFSANNTPDARELPDRRHLPAQRELRHPDAVRRRRRHAGSGLDRPVLLRADGARSRSRTSTSRDWTDGADALRPRRRAVHGAGLLQPQRRLEPPRERAGRRSTATTAR